MPDLPLSQKYLHKTEALLVDREEKRITGEEYSQRLDKLRDEEAKSHKPLGDSLIKQILIKKEEELEASVKERFKQIEQQKRNRERAEQAERDQQKINAQKEQQEKEQEKEDEQERKQRDRRIYKVKMHKDVAKLEHNAQELQGCYDKLKILLLVSSSLTAAMASVEWIQRWWVSLVGLIATIAGGYLTTFKIQDRIYAIRKAAAELKIENQNYDYGTGYENMDEQEAFIKFTGVTSKILGEQMLQEVETWNPGQEERKEDKKPRSEQKHDNSDPSGVTQKIEDNQPSISTDRATGTMPLP